MRRQCREPSLQSGLALGSSRAQTIGGMGQWRNHSQAHAIIITILGRFLDCPQIATTTVYIMAAVIFIMAAVLIILTTVIFVTAPHDVYHGPPGYWTQP